MVHPNGASHNRPLSIVDRSLFRNSEAGL